MNAPPLSSWVPTPYNLTLLESNAFEMVGTSAQLDAVFVMTTDQTADTLKKFDLEGRNFPHSSETIPDITPEQEKMAIPVIPVEYCQLIRWYCRDYRQSTFTCPRLSVQ